MIKNFEKLAELLVARARQLGAGCERVFIAVSGGVDSSLVAAILVRAFGPERVVGLYRDIRSNPQHLLDVKKLQAALGFRLLVLDLNPAYDQFVDELRYQFKAFGLEWFEENAEGADEAGFTSAYASFKSRFTTPLAGFISKAIDGGRGRIFGTGNGEEDGLLRYFDKFGDGAVDNNLLNGLNKAEVRQLAKFLGLPLEIVTKTPSADLQASGDAHNDEEELSFWARRAGFDIRLSYGAPDGSKEGNIAWAWREDIEHGIITGEKADFPPKTLKILGYSDEEVKLILFIREVERATRHKAEPPPGLERTILLKESMVE